MTIRTSSKHAWQTSVQSAWKISKNLWLLTTSGNTTDLSTGCKCGQEREAVMRELRNHNPWRRRNILNVGSDTWRADVTVSQWKWQIPPGDYTAKLTETGLLKARDINTTMELEKLIACMCIFFLFSGFYLYFSIKMESISLLMQSSLISAARINWYLQHLW